MWSLLITQLADLLLLLRCCYCLCCCCCVFVVASVALLLRCYSDVATSAADSVVAPVATEASAAATPASPAAAQRRRWQRGKVWRLFTCFFFLGKFPINFGIRLLMIAIYGVHLERGPFDKRTADFLWMMIFGALTLLVLSAIPTFSSYLIFVVFMLLYIWGREFPDAQINIYGLVSLKPNTPVRPNTAASSGAFRGRSYRLNG